MSTYAANTAVSVEASIQELKRIVERFGGQHLTVRTDNGGAQFQYRNRTVRLTLWPRPDSGHSSQARRVSWRNLVLLVKAKLAACEAGLTTFEVEFLPYLVDPNSDETVGNLLLPVLNGQTAPAQAGPVRPGPFDRFLQERYGGKLPWQS